jgi:hypothetical protein
MANLELIEHFRSTYVPSSTRKTKTFAVNLNEAISPENIEKAITDSLAGFGPEYTRYFEFGLPADVSLLFIDVCGFSTKYQHLEGEAIAEYFHKYYNIIVPIIDKYGGIVDKIIGDGIIALFGPPFFTGTFEQAIQNAYGCSKEIIKYTKGGDYSSKVALHAGKINYFKNKTGIYNEFTMIGKPLTELFRLESIAQNDCVNYYDGSLIRNWIAPNISYVRDTSVSNSEWLHVIKPIKNLKGVNYSNFYTLEYTK